MPSVPRPRTITGRVILASAVTLLVAIGTVAIAAPLVAQRYTTEDLAERLRGDAAILGDAARSAFARRDPQELDAFAKRAGAAAGIRVTLVAPDGEVLGESDEDRRQMEDHAGRPEIAAALRGEVGRATRHSATVGRDLLYVAVPVRDGGLIVGVARAAFPIERLDAIGARLAGAFLLAAALGAAAALAVGAILGRAITRPIRELARNARSGTPTAVSPNATAEVQELADAIARASREAAAERRATEAQRDRLSTLVRELGDAVLIAGRDERIRLANPAAERLLGAGPLEGRRLVEVVREHEILAAADRARAAGEAFAEVERQEPARSLSLVARLLPDGDLLIAIQDLTRVRRLETVRRDFVANVSHELRTPLASLKAMAETLEEGALDDRAAARDFVGRMHREIDEMAQLVSELLALARVESGTERLAISAVSPIDLLRDAVRRARPLAERAGVRLSLEERTGLPTVGADADRVGQVLANLLHNAVKFTPPGGIVRLRAHAEGDAVRFSVQDTGAGIPGDELERIFERFYKADRARSGGGTGLGLAIAKHLVQAHGGRIVAASDGPGSGATFSFTLPLA